MIESNTLRSHLGVPLITMQPRYAIMNANSNDKDTDRNHDAAREYFRDTSLGGGLYRSQHCGHGDSAVAMVNTMFDLMGPSGIAKMTPMYNSGVNSTPPSKATATDISRPSNSEWNRPSNLPAAPQKY